MAKKELKQYTATAQFIYSQEAYASYTIMAESDEEALEKIREILSSREMISQADDHGTIDHWFNVGGNFSLARGDLAAEEYEDDDESENVLAYKENFDIEKW